MPGDTSSDEGTWAAVCATCGDRSAVEEFRWRCGCGGLLAMAGPPADPLPGGGREDPAPPWSLWRYAPALPPAAVAGAAAVSLGEGMTPLVPGGGDLWWKLDFQNPTLSFKDRGAAVLVAAMAAAGVRSVVADSSGNAGAALAAYTARAGIAAEVYVPAGTSPGKLAAIAGAGAEVRLVDGDRAATAAAARRRVEAGGAVYASHAHQPLFTEGTKTCAYELWEQLGRRPPSTVVVAAGNGSMVLGLHRGFSDLRRAGRIDTLPTLVAVQSERCAPLAGLAPTGPTVAEGIAIAAPPRAEQIIAALRDSGGRVVTAAEEDIGAAQRHLARQGIDVEPTAAAAWAGWRTAGQAPPGPTVVVLGGAGAKGRRAP